MAADFYFRITIRTAKNGSEVMDIYADTREEADALFTALTRIKGQSLENLPAKEKSLFVQNAADTSLSTVVHEVVSYDKVGARDHEVLEDLMVRTSPKFVGMLLKRLDAQSEGEVELVGVNGVSDEAIFALLFETYGVPKEGWMMRKYFPDQHIDPANYYGNYADIVAKGADILVTQPAPKRGPKRSCSWVYAQAASNTYVDEPWWLDGGAIPEIDVNRIAPSDGRIEVRLHFYEYVDHNYANNLFSLWFDGKPVMVFHRVGDGGEVESRFITDFPRYKELVAYLRSLLPDESFQDVVDPDAELRAITEVGSCPDITLITH